MKLAYAVLKIGYIGLSIIMLSVVYAASSFSSTDAEHLPFRSIRLGSGVVGSTTTHQLGFSYIAGTTVGSVSFKYCSNSSFEADICVAPIGLDLTAATLSAQSGLTGFTISPASNANTLIINRTPGVVPSVVSSYTFSGAVNPSTSSFYYVRIELFDGNDGLGVPGDTGSVAFAVNSALTINAYVPPYLTFCAGRMVAINCSSITGDPLADLGTFSTASVATSTSEFSGATNIPTGYSVSVIGSTMAAGTYTISPLSSPTASSPGSSQFGLNLRANGIVPGSSNTTGLGIGVPSADYNIPNQFTFRNTDIIATASGPTHYTKYTVSYIVNIPNNQIPGVYATTISYVAIANL